MPTIREIKQFLAFLEEIADPCEGVIYHYTSSEGLRGIVENHEIWMTNVNFVNDTTECRALRNEINLFNEHDFNNIEIKEYWSKFLKSSANVNNTYIASFSKGEESLSQWRAYGSYRIGFDAQKLIKPSFNLFRCVYSKKEIRDWIIKKGKLKRWQSLSPDYKRSAAYFLIDAASRKYKNKHFKDEKEFRLLVTSNYKWDYPSSASMYNNQPVIHLRDHPKYNLPFPYVKFYLEKDSIAEEDQNKSETKTFLEGKEEKLAKERMPRKLLPIKDILIGPMADQEKAKIACEILLCANGYDHVKVNTSDIPFRG